MTLSNAIHDCEKLSPTKSGFATIQLVYPSLILLPGSSVDCNLSSASARNSFDGCCLVGESPDAVRPMLCYQTERAVCLSLSERKTTVWMRQDRVVRIVRPYTEAPLSRHELPKPAAAEVVPAITAAPATLPSGPAAPSQGTTQPVPTKQLIRAAGYDPNSYSREAVTHLCRTVWPILPYGAQRILNFPGAMQF
jgi:hypothetical protein